MSGRRSWLVLVVVLASAEASATDHWFDAAFGASFSRSSLLAGGHIVGTAPLGPHDHSRPLRLNVTGGVHVHGGDHEGQSLTQVTASLGLRRSFHDAVHARRVPFVHVLGVHEWRNGSALDGRHWGFAVGGGYEQRAGSDAIFVRASADVVVLPGAEETRAYPRAGVSIVLRY